MANNGLTFIEFLKSKNLKLNEMTAEQIANSTNEFLQAPNNNGITSVTSSLTSYSKLLKDKSIIISAFSLMSDPNKSHVVDANSSEYLKQLAEMLKIANDIAKEKESLESDRYAFYDTQRLASENFDKRDKALDERQNQLNKKEADVKAEQKRLDSYIIEFNNKVASLNETYEAFQKEKEVFQKEKAELDGYRKNSKDYKLQKENLDKKAAELQAKNETFASIESELIKTKDNLQEWANRLAEKQDKVDQYPIIKDENEKLRKKNRNKSIIATILGITTALGAGHGIANSIIDENEIAGLKATVSELNTDIEVLNTTLSQYKNVLSENHEKSGKFSFSYDENGNLVVSVEDIKTDDVSNINYEPFKTFFTGLVEEGALTQEVVDSIFLEDGTINVEKLSEVSTVIDGYYEDSIYYEGVINDIGEHLNGVLETVGVSTVKDENGAFIVEDGKIKYDQDEDGNNIYATIDTYSVDPDNNSETNNSYIDYVTMSDDIYSTIINVKDICLETLTSIPSQDGTVVLTEDQTQDLNTLTKIAYDLKEDVKELGEAYNNAVEGQFDLNAWLEDEDNIKNSEQITEYINNNYLSKEYVEENYISKDEINDGYVSKEEYDEVVKENEELKNSANSGIETGTSENNNTGNIPAKPSGDTSTEEEKEQEQIKNGSTVEDSNKDGYSEIGG